MNGYVSKAQKAFYDTKQDENGRPVSTTKYVARDFGFYEKESISYFTYDGKGDLLKKEVYVWNPDSLAHQIPSILREAFL